jgi:hypothetical protein
VGTRESDFRIGLGYWADMVLLAGGLDSRTRLPHVHIVAFVDPHGMLEWRVGVGGKRDECC